MSRLISMPTDILEAFTNQMELYQITKEDLHRHSRVNRTTIRKALNGGSIRKDLQLNMVNSLVYLLRNRQLNGIPKKCKKEIA
jgi:hypothetical protein